MGIDKFGNKAVTQATGKVPSRSSLKPAVDLTRCSRCGGCLEVAPEIFRFNRAGGYLEICELAHYDETLVDEAIRNCPEDCLSWERDEPATRKS